jgi:hypothetical protein
VSDREKIIQEPEPESKCTRSLICNTVFFYQAFLILFEFFFDSLPPARINKQYHPPKFPDIFPSFYNLVPPPKVIVFFTQLFVLRNHASKNGGRPTFCSYQGHVIQSKYRYRYVLRTCPSFIYGYLN